MTEFHDPVLVTLEVTVPVYDLGRKMKLARVNCMDKTGLALAEEAGISYQYWNEHERQKHPRIKLETLRRIELALGTDFGVRFTQDDLSAGLAGIDRSLQGTDQSSELATVQSDR